MNIVIGIIVGFLILMLLIVAHEAGHFIAARRNGVEVEEFGIGFPPRAIAWVKNPEYIKWQAARKKLKDAAKSSNTKSAKAASSTAELGKKPKKWLRLPKSEWNKKQKTLIFSLNWLPIGGFCSMKGESDSDKRPHSFGAASFWSKTKILFAGVAMNWLVAFIILTVLSLTGMPQFMDNQFTMPGDTVISAATITVKDVVEGSPAAAAGFQAGDQISYADDNSDPNATVIVHNMFNTASDLINFNESHAGQPVLYQIYRPSTDEHLPLYATLNSSDSEYLLGITMSQEGQALYHSTWSAPIVGAVNTVQLTGETYRGLWQMVCSLFSGIGKQLSSDEAVRSEGSSELQAVGDSVSGPVGIIGVLFPNSVSAGPTTLAFLTAIISISLACMNVLPIPALDGGRFCLIALFRLRGKTLTKEIEEKIVSRAFIFLIILIAIITVLDITRFF